jgi:hypothetical protein
MAEHDTAFRDSLGARGAHEILRCHFQHGRALETRRPGGADQTEGGGRQR